MSLQMIQFHSFLWLSNIPFVQWTIIQPQKEGNSVICDNIGGLRGHYGKSNKSDKERKIL